MVRMRKRTHSDESEVELTRWVIEGVDRRKDAETGGKRFEVKRTLRCLRTRIQNIGTSIARQWTILVDVASGSALQ